MLTRTPYFVAEVSSNHARDLERSLAFIREAARIGCDAVKFQLFRIDELFAPEILARSEEHRRRRAWELPESFLPELAGACREAGVAFSCTPFFLDAVDLLAPHVAFFKVASYELPWDALLERCARAGKPVVLSTGMATQAEVERAVQVLEGAGATEVHLLHCVSGYPTPVAECNLAAIATLREALDRPVGWSDHSRRPEVVGRAVGHWGAHLVEFHLDLEGQGDEYAAGHCWLPDEIEAVIRAARAGESSGDASADGDGRKVPAPCERADVPWRADPSDGLRPLKALRETFGG